MHWTTHIMIMRIVASCGSVGRKLALRAGDRGSIPVRDRPKSLKQVMTAPLPNALRQDGVPIVLQGWPFKTDSFSCATSYENISYKSVG